MYKINDNIDRQFATSPTYICYHSEAAVHFSLDHMNKEDEEGETYIVEGNLCGNLRIN